MDVGMLAAGLLLRKGLPKELWASSLQKLSWRSFNASESTPYSKLKVGESLALNLVSGTSRRRCA